MTNELIGIDTQVGDIVSRFEKKGFVLKGMKMFQCPKEVAEAQIAEPEVLFKAGELGVGEKHSCAVETVETVEHHKLKC